jgi:hypothetical protein
MVGLAAYLILSYLFVPLRFIIPLAIITSVLIFELSEYYAANYNNGKSRNNLVIYHHLFY